jgi:hypothetical protein
VRIQFLIAAHRDPALLIRLCERLLTAPDAAITVQWDRASPPLTLPHALGVAQRVTRAPCEWGSGAQLDAMLDSLRALAEAEFDWLVVLSGQDSPIRPLTELDDLLAHTSHRLFLDAPAGGRVPLPAAHTEWTYLQDRYFYQYHWVPQRWWAKLPPGAQRIMSGGMKRVIGSGSQGRRMRVQRRTRTLSPALGIRAREHPFTPDRPCRKGSDWFVISRPVFDDLRKQIDEDLELVQYFRRTYLPIESLVHTVLLPTWEDQNAGHNLHYRRFVPGRAHPEFLDDSDWGDFVAGGAFFARKFGPGSTELLDRIDRELLAR